MRILLLCHLFNSLSQRLLVALRRDGHTVSVELDISDAVTEEAVALFRPDVLLAPFLKRKIPASVWRQLPCLVVHPGPPGDRGPSALDWALLRGTPAWGVTVLQANDEFDAGPVWAHAPVAMRPGATKSSLYRREVTQAAMGAVREALLALAPTLDAAAAVAMADADGASQGAAVNGARVASSTAGEDATPSLQHGPGDHGWQPLMRQADRAIDWARDSTATIVRHINASDGFPGLLTTLFGEPTHVFDAHPATPASWQHAAGQPPGTAIAQRGPALLLRTVDGALWLGQVRRGSASALKLAATLAFADHAAALPMLALPLIQGSGESTLIATPPDEWDELHYDESGPPGARVGWLAFPFHNGAMSTRQCERLRDALRHLRQRPTQVLVLAGGADFFSNGIHLHEIEAAAERPGDSAADASWRNINAMDDATLEVLTLTDRLTVAALRGNAGAGGCFLALAADQLWAHAGVVLNPHYKNMGNLYGSEYWTYTLPRRVGAATARQITQGRLPLGAQDAQDLGLLDAVLAPDAAGFEAAARAHARALAAAPDIAQRIARKAAQRAADEADKPLAAYRADELARMHRNFYGFDPSYHIARHHFVHRKPQAWTPRHLAVHRG